MSGQRAKRERRSLLAVSAEIGLGSGGRVNIRECSQLSSRGSELKRLISSDQNGKLASSGSTNCPDTDDAQPVERADLPRLLRRMHGTWKPRTSAERQDETARHVDGSAGLRWRKKQRPSVTGWIRVKTSLGSKGRPRPPGASLRKSLKNRNSIQEANEHGQQDIACA